MSLGRSAEMFMVKGDMCNTSNHKVVICLLSNIFPEGVCAKLVSVICLVIIGMMQVFAQPVVNPLNYGLNDASSSVERYACLLACHKDAVMRNCDISYSGIDTLDIELPANAESIPLPSNVDFAGVKLRVLNNQRNMPLFSVNMVETDAQVDAQSINSGNFKKYGNLSNGRYLLIIEDIVPWVANRRGYSYGASRRDLLLVNNGLALNHVTYNYSSGEASPKVSIVKAPSGASYRNIIFDRDKKSSRMTYLFSINNSYDVELSNLKINTPQDNALYGDVAIQIKNCVKVSVHDLTINGTYSQIRQYGYGVSLENVVLFSGERINARARWGVFGTNNVNDVALIDCDINRFDLHCYGKDVRCYNCKFSDLYNQFSSVFGDVYFEKCLFTNFIPVLMESSYNAYTPFDLTFKSCTFNLTAKKNYLVMLRGLEEAQNPRPELSRKSLPNIVVNNCTVNLADDIKEWYIINTGKVSYKEPLDYISIIKIYRLLINSNIDYTVFSTDIKTTESLKIIRKRVKLKG